MSLIAVNILMGHQNSYQLEAKSSQLSRVLIFQLIHAGACTIKLFTAVIYQF